MPALRRARIFALLLGCTLAFASQADRKHKLTSAWRADETTDFVEEMFDEEVRGQLGAKIQDAVQKGRTTVFFIDDGERELIKECLRLGWNWANKNAEHDLGKCHASDVELMAVIGRYIKTKSLALYVPDLVPNGDLDGVPKYTLRGYTKRELTRETGKGSGVDALLDLFLAGAHLVVVHSDRDTSRPIPSLYNVLNLALDTATPLANSHYSGLPWKARGVNNLVQNIAYPNGIEKPYPFVVSLLAAVTSRDNLVSGALHMLKRLGELDGDGPLYDGTSIHGYNTFLQLEGWPLYPSGLLPETRLSLKDCLGLRFTDSVRHGADLVAHQASLWNISTYGASAYSEKRGTSVFIAPVGWDPQVSPKGAMAHYTGFDGTNAWFECKYIGSEKQCGK